MTGQEIYEVLVSQGVRKLHHANSVQTALSLLRLGGLASRQRVEQEGLPQRNQITDRLDRQFGIWGDIFLDTVDIHARISDRNKYGPVLFVLDVEILRTLPEGSRVLITRSNPSKWNVASSDAQRYFMNYQELVNDLVVGDFDQMLVIRVDGGMLPFGNFLKTIILDEPRLVDGESDEYANAADELFRLSGGRVDVVKRNCARWCKCTMSYVEKSTRIPWFFSLS